MTIAEHERHGAHGRFAWRAKDSVVAVDPAYLRGGAAFAGLALVAGLLWGASRRVNGAGSRDRSKM
ncbi:hypothetical protein [Methylocystis iwaonis]|uniref:hypothetical protein n=1 Tax=Methylocystis iwaonis TaxID=2885079 RepID=UPI002E7B3FC5|nr:hypothetical protein [Methylocystis iwaonis]